VGGGPIAKTHIGCHGLHSIRFEALSPNTYAGGFEPPVPHQEKVVEKITLSTHSTSALSGDGSDSFESV